MRAWIGSLLVLLASWVPAGAAVDHSQWSEVLRTFVHDGQVDYAGLRHNVTFDRYLGDLANVHFDTLTDQKDRLATAINAYNAFAIKGVLNHWPVTQVTAVPGFFNAIKYAFGGREVTLDQLENDILRPMGDPRVHAALNGAARGCAPLRGEAYTAANLDQQLDDQARKWVNDPTWNRLDKATHKLQVSRIFDWYKVDFERSGGPAGFVRQYLAAEADRAWLAAGDYQIEYIKFDWTLNAK